MSQHENIIDQRLQIVLRQQRERRHRAAFGPVANRSQQVVAHRFGAVRRRGELENAATKIGRPRIEILRRASRSIAVQSMTRSTQPIEQRLAAKHLFRRRRIASDPFRTARRAAVFFDNFRELLLRLRGKLRYVLARSPICILRRLTANCPECNNQKHEPPGDIDRAVCSRHESVVGSIERLKETHSHASRHRLQTFITDFPTRWKARRVRGVTIPAGRHHRHRCQPAAIGRHVHRRLRRPADGVARGAK